MSSSGWSQPFENLVVWNELDYGESDDSGSALIINDIDPSGGGVPVALRQCVPVESGRRYLYGMKNYIPAGQAPNSAGYLIVDAHAGSDCLGTPVTSDFIGQFNDLNWHQADGAMVTDVGVQVFACPWAYSSPPASAQSCRHSSMTSICSMISCMPMA